MVDFGGLAGPGGPGDPSKSFAPHLLEGAPGAGHKPPKIGSSGSGGRLVVITF
jgi:hypothetical protein